MGEAGIAVTGYLDQVARHGNTGAVRAALPQIDMRLRLHSLHGAVLILGENAPDEWRQEAARGLFVGERGYLRPM